MNCCCSNPICRERGCQAMIGYAQSPDGIVGMSSHALKDMQNELTRLREENARIQHAAERHRELAAERLTEMMRMKAVVAAARRASQEIQAQKVNWPGEVDTLMDALKALDKSGDG